MIEITEAPIDHAALTDRVRSKLAGAVCTFLGTVREMTGERRTASLDYEARCVKFGPCFEPSADVEQDLRRVEAFFAGVRGKKEK